MLKAYRFRWISDNKAPTWAKDSDGAKQTNSGLRQSLKFRSSLHDLKINKNEKSPSVAPTSIYRSADRK